MGAWKPGRDTAVGDLRCLWISIVFRRKHYPTLERVEFVESLLLFVFAGWLVTGIELGRRGFLFSFAISGGRAGISARLHLCGAVYIVCLRRGLRRLFNRRQGLVVGWTDRLPIHQYSVRPELQQLAPPRLRLRRLRPDLRASLPAALSWRGWGRRSRLRWYRTAFTRTDDAGADSRSAARRCATIRSGHILQLKRVLPPSGGGDAGSSVSSNRG